MQSKSPSKDDSVSEDTGEGTVVFLELKMQSTERRETKLERRKLEGLTLSAGEAGFLRGRPQFILVWGCSLCSGSGHTTI